MIENAVGYSFFSMESQPQNPEFRIILKTFIHVNILLPSKNREALNKEDSWFGIIPSL